MMAGWLEEGAIEGRTQSIWECSSCEWVGGEGYVAWRWSSAALVFIDGSGLPSVYNRAGQDWAHVGLMVDRLTLSSWSASSIG